MPMPPPLVAIQKTGENAHARKWCPFGRWNRKTFIPADFLLRHVPLLTREFTRPFSRHGGVKNGFDFRVKIWRPTSHSVRGIEDSKTCNKSCVTDRQHFWQLPLPFHTRHKPFLQKLACSSVDKDQRSFLSDAPVEGRCSTAGRVPAPA